jgi:hypothetical protein
MPADDPQSPCNRHCTLDPDSDTCIGCLRTLEEIMRWTQMSAAEKRALLEELPRRRAVRAQREAR